MQRWVSFCAPCTTFRPRRRRALPKRQTRKSNGDANTWVSTPSTRPAPCFPAARAGKLVGHPTGPHARIASPQAARAAARGRPGAAHLLFAKKQGSRKGSFFSTWRASRPLGGAPPRAVAGGGRLLLAARRATALRRAGPPPRRGRGAGAARAARRRAGGGTHARACVPLTQSRGAGRALRAAPPPPGSEGKRQALGWPRAPPSPPPHRAAVA